MEKDEREENSGKKEKVNGNVGEREVREYELK